ncbi:MAG: AI-2E family transporter [Bacillota bacterium]|nr:AI-2E family transporter [Bacillota bacterium]
MQFKYRKIPYWKYIPIIIIAIVVYKLVDNADQLINGVKFVLSVLSYLFWAFAIAYALNPLMVFLEKKLKIRRALSISIIYFIFTALIIFSITILAPMIINSITQLNLNFSEYVKKTANWAEGKIADFKIIDDQYNVSNYLKNNMENILNQSQNLLITLINYVFSNLINITSTIFKLILGITISIYLLYDKEAILTTIKKTLYVALKKTYAQNVISFGKKANDVFSRYIIGKILDSAIIGLICFVFCMVVNIPYALLISLLVGIFNLIPYFGTLIGIVPSVLITLFISPVKALWLLIFLLVLGQIDGTVIAPKIIGDKIGLNPILIMIAITIGGSIYGVVGMFLAVPFMALLKSIFLNFIDSRLEANKDS